MPTLEATGTVQNGEIILDKSIALPNGTQVRVVPIFPPDSVDDLLQERTESEFVPWDTAADDAWAMIDEWERVEKQ